MKRVEGLEERIAQARADAEIGTKVKFWDGVKVKIVKTGTVASFTTTGAYIYDKDADANATSGRMAGEWFPFAAPRRNSGIILA